MGKTFMPQLGNAEELRALQTEGLKWTVNHAYEGSPFYKENLDKGGIRPGDIKSLEDIERKMMNECVE